MAATCAVVEYDMEGLDPPILTVEQAVQRSSFFQIPPFVNPHPVGNFGKGMDEADQKIMSAEVGNIYNIFHLAPYALSLLHDI